jgi:hypothetical protein
MLLAEGRTRGRVNVLRAEPIFTPPPNRHAGSASRSERIPGIEMPRECPPAFRSERAAAGTDSAKRRSVRLPSAIAPVRCHVRCCVSRAKAQCGGHADLAGLTPRRNHGRLIRSQDDGVGVPALPASSGWHQPVPGLAASRYDWLL